MSNVLIVSDTHQSNAVVASLAHASDGPFTTECVTSLSAALARIANGEVDIVLAHLELTDSSGITTFDQLFAAARHIPIMTLADDDGEGIAREAVQRGAQGYLTAGHYSSSLFPQALRNIIERKAVEVALHKERAYAEATLNCIGDAVISIDMNGDITYFNPAAELLTGWERTRAQGRHVNDVLRLIDSETRKSLEPHPVVEAIQKGAPTELPAATLLIQENGQEIFIEDSIAPIVGRFGEPLGAVVVFRDVSEARALNAQISHMANHDFLTGLPNRVLFKDRLSHEIVRAERKDTSLAVLFLDLDKFKHINDALGHEAGDQVLQAVAEKLSACVRNMDTVCRLGGDEFVILLADNMDVASVASVAKKIHDMLAEPLSIAGQEIDITTSIGASIYPSDGRDVTTLLKHADTAMYRAKEKGRNNYQFFDARINAHATEK